MTEEKNVNVYARSLSWKQGILLTMGVPVLVLPSIGYLAGYLWGAAILMWGLSIAQAFLQVTAFGELATVFPEESGLPGFSQRVFTGKNPSEYSFGKLVGGLSAWGYWFGWNAVISIYAITAASSMTGLLPDWFGGIDPTTFSFIVCFVIMASLTLIVAKGVGNGAWVGILLAVFSIIPLTILSIGPMIGGQFLLGNITGSWWPANWSWDLNGILIILGLAGIAGWSAWGIEGAAIFGPQYKNPHSDVPKALFGAGFIALFFFLLTQIACTGTLGVNGVIAQGVSPFVPIATMTFGSIGGGALVIMLVAAMILCIMTSYLISGGAMQAMAQSGYLPKPFAKLNKHGVPVNSLLVIFAFNMFLIWLGTPQAILTASALGYTLGTGITLFAYYKAKTDPEMSKLPRPFKAPRGYKWVALAVGIFDVPFCMIGIFYLYGSGGNWIPVIAGVAILLLYIPIWWFSRRAYGAAKRLEKTNIKAGPEGPAE